NHLDLLPGKTMRGREHSRNGLRHGVADDLLADQHAGLAVLHEHYLQQVGVPAACDDRLDAAWVFLLWRKSGSLVEQRLSGNDVGHQASPCYFGTEETHRE